MANELINIEVLNLNNDKVKAWVEKKIKEVGHLTIKKVEVLPETDIDPLCIYFVPAKKAGTYDEYMYIGNQWELIGSSDVDLEDYYKKSETDDAIDTAVGEHNESESAHSDIRELIQDNADSIGDLSTLKTTAKDSAVDAVNSVYDKQTKSITMSEDGVNMVFTKNDDTTVEFPLRSVIDETELTGLADVDADEIEDGQYLKYDAENKKFVPETVDNESQYNASKAYTDERLEEVALPTPESKDKLLLSVENEETSELEWSQVDKSTVGDSPFIGTKEEWEALSLEEKAQYETVIFTDDTSTGLIDDILKTIYPVGSVYISVNNVNPATFISGTTWERLAKGRTLWNVDDNQSGGDLISAGIPNITGNLSYGIPANNAIGVVTATGAFSGTTPQQIGVPISGSIVTMSPGTKFTASSGETKRDGTVKNDVYGKSDTVQPPSIGVYMWKRTA